MPSQPPCPITAVSWIRGSKTSTTCSASTLSAGPPSLEMSTHLIYDLKGAQVVLSEAPQSPGFLDPTFGLRYSGISLPGRWQMSVETAMKCRIRWRAPAAVDGPRRLRHAGLRSRRLGSQERAGTWTFPAVYYAGEALPSPHEAQMVPTIVVGWERILTARTNLNLQCYASSSVYKPEQTDLDELLSDKYQMSLGVRHRFDCCCVTFARHRESAESQQHAGHRIPVWIRVGAEAQAAVKMGTFLISL